MKDYFIVEIDTIPYVKLSSVMLSNKKVCPIVGYKNGEYDCVEELITGRKISSGINNYQSCGLTYSNLIPLDNNMICNYVSILNSLTKEDIEEYNMYLNYIISTIVLNRLEYSYYNNKLENLENEFKLKRKNN